MSAAQSRKPTNVSRAREQDPARITEQARRWRAEDAKAIAASNAFVEKQGLPLAALRRF